MLCAFMYRIPLLLRCRQQLNLGCSEKESSLMSKPKLDGMDPRRGYSVWTSEVEARSMASGYTRLNTCHFRLVATLSGNLVRSCFAKLYFIMIVKCQYCHRKNHKKNLLTSVKWWTVWIALPDYHWLVMLGILHMENCPRIMHMLTTGYIRGEK